MPFLRPFIRAQINFALPDGEVAAITYGLETATTNTGMSSTFVNELEARAATWWGVVDNYYSSQTKYTGVKAALYSVDGVTVQTVEKPVTGINGASASPNLPTEVAMCCTLLTPFADRSSRGRMYLPAPAISVVDSNGRLNATAAGVIVGATADLLNPLVDGSLTYTSVVVSRTKQKASKVTAVRLGNVFDVQRRRRDSHAEVTQLSTVD